MSINLDSWNANDGKFESETKLLTVIHRRNQSNTRSVAWGFRLFGLGEGGG